MLIFFAVSGTWQELHLQWHNDILNLLSTIHTGNGLKSKSVSSLSSPYLIWFIVLMAASLVLNIILGLIMAFRFGRRPLVLGCLAAGIVIPFLLIFIFAR
jgi:hypothetical protein